MSHRDAAYWTDRLSKIAEQNRALTARVRELEAEVKTVREAMDAMESMPTGMSPAVCRSMGKYWNGLADRIAREGPVRGDGDRYCHCADPENCTEAVPNYICKAGKSCSPLSAGAEHG